MTKFFMRQQILLIILMATALGFAVRDAHAAPGDAPLDLGEVVVTANRAPVPVDRATRPVTVLTRQDIEALPAVTVPELLEYAAGVDVKQRAPGAQADFHVNGGGFDQTAVLLNGIRVNDIQTGHHNADLPVTVGDIERIEILRGQGSALYGPDAIGGVINIVTRTPDRGAATGRVRVSGSAPAARGAALEAAGNSWRFSAARDSSNGFRPGTDTRETTLYFDNAAAAGLRLTAGYNDKLFGADSFYVPGWPSREHTETRFMTLNAARDLDAGRLAADVYVRRHDDRFDCSVTQPSLCINTHRTQRVGTEITFQRGAGGGAPGFTAGVLAEHDRIASSNIGRRNHDRNAAFVQTGVSVSRRLNVDAGLRADRHQGYRAQWAPSLSAAYAAANDTTLRAAWGRAFRAPTYTELFYGDPAHVSFAGLEPETATSYELGARGHARGITWDASLFTRRTAGFIDWRRATPASPWVIGNQAPARFRGASISLQSRAGARGAWSLSHDFLAIALPAGAEFKYTGARPRHMVRAGYRHTLARAVADVRARYEKPRIGEHIFLVDMAWHAPHRGADLTLRVQNVFDRAYEDVPGAPMPGRTLTLSVQWPSHTRTRGHGKPLDQTAE